MKYKTAIRNKDPLLCGLSATGRHLCRRYEIQRVECAAQMLTAVCCLRAQPQGLEWQAGVTWCIVWPCLLQGAFPGMGNTVGCSSR